MGVLSVVTFVVSLLLIPWVIGRLPEKYFIRHKQDVEVRHRRHPVLTCVIFVVRNFFGLILCIAGISMLVLPGQGLLTMLIGISLIDFPGKNHFVDAVLQNHKVRKVLNWIRRKEKKRPFVF